MNAHTLVLVFALFALALGAHDDFKNVASKAYVLSMQKCDQNSPWTLHGLWPEYGQNCGHSFDERALDPIRADLEKRWHSCPQYSQSNVQFWTHEYTKHGSCMKNLTELEYFSTGLDLLEKHTPSCTSVRSGECRICLDMNLNPC
eukprot:TRINITY_DN17685_c0_g1_i1.p1 TRINITY_DN17685_c0_g1~~TRINITY_DN17685_c0_g1_i1.p1  ORF type:complete len:145 (+),score=14.89 TRINITY_DN17685_c0_g1_i1:42-476(+)